MLSVQMVCIINLVANYEFGHTPAVQMCATICSLYESAIALLEAAQVLKHLDTVQISSSDAAQRMKVFTFW
jgi:hypothetical protein